MMEMDYCFTIEKNYEGTRMDSVLSLLLTEASRSYIVKLIEQGRLTVNGKVETSKKYKVKEGDVIRLEMPEPELLKVEAEDIPLDIVYEDDDLLVVNKPRGMVVHPAQGNYTGTLVNALMYHCKDRLSSINGVIRPGIVHRIDKDTSGLLMVAKNDKAHESLSEQLRVHSINRRYVALVYDNMKSSLRGKTLADSHPGESLHVPDGRWVYQMERCPALINRLGGLNDNIPSFRMRPP